MFYPSSENNGADQLRGYREADLRLCFRLCRLLVFPWCGSNDDNVHCTDQLIDATKGGSFNKDIDVTGN